MCDNISKRKEKNDDRIRAKVEADENIEWASNKVEPIIKKLEEVETYDNEVNDEEEEYDHRSPQDRLAYLKDLYPLFCQS